MHIEQFVMAYEVEQDRLRALVPHGFKSLRPVLRINAEIRGGTPYVEFNTAVEAQDGTRGWINEFGVKAEDERLIKREALRLEMSLNEGKKLKEQYPDDEIIVFMHYPPVFGSFINYDIVDVLYRFGVEKVYYGHLHNVRPEQLDKEYLGIKLTLTACDFLDFKPLKID